MVEEQFRTRAYARFALAALMITLGLFRGPVAAAQTATPVWQSGFEEGYPGEWLGLSEAEVGFSADGSDLPGRSASWTIVDRQSGEPVFEGDKAYRGWIHGSSSESHRAYPALHANTPSPVVNSFRVWLDADYEAMSELDWVHFGTWGNNENWTVFTMSMRNRVVELAHLDWSYVGPEPQPEFPLRRWVRFTVYVDFAGGGAVAVWQDGVLIFRGTYSGAPGDHLLRAHWGMYARAQVSDAVEYNDAIQLWTLSEPLHDFAEEPPSPYEPDGYLPSTPADEGPDEEASGGGCDVGRGSPHAHGFALLVFASFALLSTRRRWMR